MARKTNASIRTMNLNEIENYVAQHPAEGYRCANETGKTAAYCIQRGIEHSIRQAKAAAMPPRLQTE